MLKDFPYSREMTPQEKEEQRSLRVKVHYCELIQYEIQKLTEDQLYKILVLVKNTTDQMKNESRPSPKVPSKNRSLFPQSLITTMNRVSDEMGVEEEAVRKIVHKHGLIGGHGIFSMARLAKDESADGYAVCVCFCVPGKLDCMITIFEKAHERFFYKLTTSEVGFDGNVNEVELYTLAQVEQAIKNISDKYKNE